MSNLLQTSTSTDIVIGLFGCGNLPSRVTGLRVECVTGTITFIPRTRSERPKTETVRVVVDGDVHAELLKIAGELQATDGKARSAEDAIKSLVQRWQQQKKKVFRCPACGEVVSDLFAADLTEKLHEHIGKCSQRESS